MPKPSDRAIAQAFRELVEAESFNVLHHTIIERAKALDGSADFAKSAARERDAAAPAGAHAPVVCWFEVTHPRVNGGHPMVIDGPLTEESKAAGWIERPLHAGPQPATVGARTARLDLSVFDQPGDPRSNLIKRGWTPPGEPTASADAVDAGRWRFVRSANADDGQPFIAQWHTNDWGRHAVRWLAGDEADAAVDAALRPNEGT